MTFTAATLCSGIGAPETAMPEWRWLWCGEIEPFPAHVLAERFGASAPEVMPDPDIAGGLAHPLGRNNGQENALVSQWTVRRLTTIECARLQGFPDRHTQIPWGGKEADDCPLGPQYKGYGNSMPVPVIRWICRRIEEVRKEDDRWK